MARHPDALAPRLDYIDGLRALAALWIVLHHVVESAQPLGLMSLPILGYLIRSLFFGQFAVIVFLMLSGFCLYYPCVKRSPDAPRLTTSPRAYLLRRWGRIAPPYFAAGTLCSLFVAFPLLHVGHWRGVARLDWQTIAAHLMFVHNLFPEHRFTIDYPMWSIGLEFQLYLLFPLMVGAFRRSGAFPVLAATLALALAIRGCYRQLPPVLGFALHAGPFAYLEIFALGMLAAALAARGLAAPRRWLWGALALAAFAAVRVGSGDGLLHDLATASGTFAVLRLAATPNSAVARALSARWLARIGVFSYSLYLMHAPVVHLLWWWQRPLGLSGDVRFALLSLTAVPLALAVSYVFHLAFERPFMRAASAAAPSIEHAPAYQ